MDSSPASYILRLKCDGTLAETRFRLSAKRTNPFKSAGASVQSTTGSRGVRIIGSNAGYTKFRGSVKSIGYPLHSPASPSLPRPCVTVCHHVSTGLYTDVTIWINNYIYFPRFGVSSVLMVRIRGFRVISLSSNGNNSRRFELRYCLHLQGHEVRRIYPRLSFKITN